VIVTLLYLARQVQQNTKAERIGSAQQILSTGARMNTEHARNSDLFEVLVKIRGEDQFTPREQVLYDLFQASIFSQHWQVHYQFDQGSLDDEYAPVSTKFAYANLPPAWRAPNAGR